MTNDGWSSKWPSAFNKAADEAMSKASGIPENWGNWPKPPELIGLDLGIGDRTVLTTFESDGIKHRVIDQKELKSQGSNLVDDQQYLYFQCDECQAILEPHTKSFKTLEAARFDAGWKVKWNTDGMGYKVYCAKCCKS